MDTGRRALEAYQAAGEPRSESHSLTSCKVSPYRLKGGRAAMKAAGCTECRTAGCPSLMAPRIGGPCKPASWNRQKCSLIWRSGHPLKMWKPTGSNLRSLFKVVTSIRHSPTLKHQPGPADRGIRSELAVVLRSRRQAGTCGGKEAFAGGGSELAQSSVKSWANTVRTHKYGPNKPPDYTNEDKIEAARNDLVRIKRYYEGQPLYEALSSGHARQRRKKTVRNRF